MLMASVKADLATWNLSDHYCGHAFEAHLDTLMSQGGVPWLAPEVNLLSKRGLPSRAFCMGITGLSSPVMSP